MKTFAEEFVACARGDITVALATAESILAEICLQSRALCCELAHQQQSKDSNADSAWSHPDNAIPNLLK